MKWDQKYEIASNEVWTFRAKIYLNPTGQGKILAIIKGLSGEELRISGDYNSFLRKLKELSALIKEIEKDIEFAQKVSSPPIDDVDGEDGMV